MRHIWYHVGFRKVHFSIFFYNLNIEPRPVLQQVMPATSPTRLFSTFSQSATSLPGKSFNSAPKVRRVRNQSTQSFPNLLLVPFPLLSGRLTRHSQSKEILHFFKEHFVFFWCFVAFFCVLITKNWQFSHPRAFFRIFKKLYFACHQPDSNTLFLVLKQLFGGSVLLKQKTVF